MGLILCVNMKYKEHLEVAEYVNDTEMIVGIDEVGRGCIAGPVIAVSFICFDISKILSYGIKDSKKLSEKKREEIFYRIQNEKSCKYAIGSANLDEIKEYNILNATNLAIHRSYDNLDIYADIVLIDGINHPQIEKANITKSIIGGDDSVIQISAASIIAKVIRDRYMRYLSQIYPVYSWEDNKGYGTKKHIEAIQKHGISKLHRIDFAPVKKYHNANIMV